MFERPTLFIIGAGCSKEFGLPLGIDLRRQIASLAKQLFGPHQGAQADMVSRAWNLNANYGPEILRLKAQEIAAGVMTRPSIDGVPKPPFQRCTDASARQAADRELHPVC